MEQKSSPQDYLSRLQPFLTKEPSYLDSVKSHMNPPETQVPQEPDFGIPFKEFNSQVSGLIDKGHPADLIHRAIDNIPGITDKVGAKQHVNQMSQMPTVEKPKVFKTIKEAAGDLIDKNK